MNETRLHLNRYPGQPISVGIEVPAVDACTDLVEKCGGKTLVGKVALPGVGWFAVCQDSEGNTFAIFQPDPTAFQPDPTAR